MNKLDIGKSLIFVACLLILLPVSTFAKESGFLAPDSFAELAEAVSPAVVNIGIEKTVTGHGRVFRHFFQGPFDKGHPFKDFFGDEKREYTQKSLGSGFVIDKDGYIVTNNHVIEDADKIIVKLRNGEEYPAEIIGGDPLTDIALIKTKAGHDLPVATIGDSDVLKVGEWVVAIGNPFGLDHTITTGIVSAKGRVIGSGPYDDFIQTDASINPGNSGGPLVNIRGEVVGINTAIIAGGSGIGFAVPINSARNVIAQLKKHGEVTRGWIGVAVQELDEKLASYYGIDRGALVSEVFSGDPAEKAGIRPKDVIVEIDGQKIENVRDLTSLIANKRVGDTVKIKAVRNGSEMTFDVKVAKREDWPDIAGKSRKKGPADDFGIKVSEWTNEIAKRLDVMKDEGVVVIGVEAESKGEKAGVRLGDIILEVNRVPVKTVGEYNKEIGKVKKGETIRLFVKRMGVGFVIAKLTK